MTHTALASMVIVECAYHFLLDDVTFSLLRREQIRIFYAPHLATAGRPQGVLCSNTSGLGGIYAWWKKMAVVPARALPLRALHEDDLADVGFILQDDL